MSSNKRKLGLVPSLPAALNPVHQLRVIGRLVRRRTTRPGASPGTLTPGAPSVDIVRIQVIEYGPDDLRERSVEKCSDALPFEDQPTITWVNVEGLHDLELMRDMGERLGLHPPEEPLSDAHPPILRQYGEAGDADVSEPAPITDDTHWHVAHLGDPVDSNPMHNLMPNRPPRHAQRSIGRARRPP